MVLRKTDKFRFKDGTPRPFWGCSRFPDCKETHGAHPDGRPLGIPGDKETRGLRHQCHAEIDAMDYPPKNEIYGQLSELLGVAEVHFGACTKEDCWAVLNHLEALRECHP
jgi:ssDNA-binding Zn-finger/Zn-ribbon topoisomerase 1